MTDNKLIELQTSQCEKDFEQAKRINKEIDKRVTHWEEAIRIIKSLGSVDKFESYADWEERMYYSEIDAIKFLIKMNEL